MRGVVMGREGGYERCSDEGGREGVRGVVMRREGVNKSVMREGGG